MQNFTFASIFDIINPVLSQIGGINFLELPFFRRDKSSAVTALAYFWHMSCGVFWKHSCRYAHVKDGGVVGDFWPIKFMILLPQKAEPWNETCTAI